MPPAPKRRFYLTKPSQFKITYAINPWMNPKNKVDKAVAQKEWDAVHDAYVKLGAEVEVFEPLKGWPDSVFVGDSIFLYGKQAFASRFRYPERSGEVGPILERFESKDYDIIHMPEGLFFEGNGEMMAWGDKIIAGYGVRSDKKALDFIESTLGVEVIKIRVMPPHFHVDTCVCPLDENTIAYVPLGMDEDSVAILKGLDANLIEIDNAEALLLACNSMALGKQVILSTVKAPLFSEALAKAGFEPMPLDLTEFAKSGGGAKCLTLEAYKYE
jgi:N-dimethylarginine dimethylaminohydrolase